MGDIIYAAAVRDCFSFWVKELLKLPGAHAIIHDKVVAIDPFSPRCTVITGSHNFGYKASYSNDENMIIISGNMALSAAMQHILWTFTIIIVGDLRCKMNKKGLGILLIEMTAGKISITVKLVLTEMIWIFGSNDKYVTSSCRFLYT